MSLRKAVESDRILAATAGPKHPRLEYLSQWEGLKRPILDRVSVGPDRVRLDQGRLREAVEFVSHNCQAARLDRLEVDLLLILDL